MSEEKEIHICEYGCGQEATHQFKSGKWCCSRSTSCCPEVSSNNHTNKGQPSKKKGKIYKIEIIKENPGLCEYGCGQEAKFYLKYVKKWCCSESFNTCPSRTDSRKYIPFENEQNILCNYGCGRIARYKSKGGKFCCEEIFFKCPIIKQKNSEGQIGKKLSSEHIKSIGDTLRGRKRGPFSEEWKLNISISKTGKKIKPCSDIHKINLRNSVSPERWMQISIRRIETYKKNGSGDKQRERIKLNYKTIVKKFRKTMIERGFMCRDEDLSSLNLYRRLVWQITYASIREKFSKEELKERGSKKELGHKHVDHNFSVFEGFKLGILPQIIGSKSNIRLIDLTYNCSKKEKCDITLEELFKLYDEEMGVIIKEDKFLTSKGDLKCH